MLNSMFTKKSIIHLVYMKQIPIHFLKKDNKVLLFMFIIYYVYCLLFVSILLAMH